MAIAPSDDAWCPPPDEAPSVGAAVGILAIVAIVCPAKSLLVWQEQTLLLPLRKVRMVLAGSCSGESAALLPTIRA